MANVETRRDEYTFLGSAGATYEHIFYERRLDHTSLFYRDLGARWLTTRSKKDIRRSNKNRLTLSNSPIYGWWRPAWNLSFEGRVRNVAEAGLTIGVDGPHRDRRDAGRGAAATAAFEVSNLSRARRPGVWRGAGAPRGPRARFRDF